MVQTIRKRGVGSHKVSHAKAKRNRGRPAKEQGGEIKRDSILDAAEVLFAEHGFDGVTVRQVTRKANVDVALAHYYFGTKRGLFDAVFLRRAAILNEARLKAIDDYQINPGPGGATIEGFIQAFLDPVMERWAKGGSVAGARGGTGGY